MDGILEELGLKVSSNEIEAFIKEALLMGNDSVSSIVHKIFPESGITFKDEAQEVAFYNYLEELWERLAEEYKKIIEDDEK